MIDNITPLSLCLQYKFVFWHCLIDFDKVFLNECWPEMNCVAYHYNHHDNPVSFIRDRDQRIQAECCTYCLKDHFIAGFPSAQWCEEWSSAGILFPIFTDQLIMSPGITLGKTHNNVSAVITWMWWAYNRAEAMGYKNLWFTIVEVWGNPKCWVFLS